MDHFFSQDETGRPNYDDSKISIYYRMNYGTAYNQESQAIRGIIRRGVTATEENRKIDLRIYCRPNLMASLIMKNSSVPPKEKEEKTNVVYKFKCSEGNCESPESIYIGFTTTTLRRRFQSHRNQGAIFQHYTEKHNRRPTVSKLLQCTNIIEQENDKRKLMIAEAVHIKLQKPSLNIQTTSYYILPSTRRQRALDVEGGSRVSNVNRP